MLLLKLIFVAVVPALTPIAGATQAQENPPAKQENPAPEPVDDSFFSGFVSEYSAAKITVSRVVLGRRAEKRTFLITSATKIEGKIKNKARVTVRFASNDDGDVATAILVRGNQKKQ